MNYMNHAILRSALAVVLGVVLVLWPETSIAYLVITIGVLFILPGVVSILHFFTAERDDYTPSPTFPVEAAGSILFGIWLVVMPHFFVNILMYVLGGLLLIAGAHQIVMLVRARKYRSVGWGFYVIPVMLTLTGAVILANPFGVASMAFIVFGVAAMVYGVTELINVYRFRRK